MANQLEDASLMLQASHEQHQLLTRQDSQLRASLQDHQSRVAVLEGSLQREQQKTSNLTKEVQTLSSTIREMKTLQDTLSTKDKVVLPEKAGEALKIKDRELQDARRDTQSWMQRGMEAIRINDELQAELMNHKAQSAEWEQRYKDLERSHYHSDKKIQQCCSCWHFADFGGSSSTSFLLA